MSLTQRLQAVIPERSNRGCVTCQYLDDMSDADRRAFDDWVAGGYSHSQLWEICISDPDSPLTISITGFRHHMKHHQPR
jgi:hypothetical protein